MYITFATNLVNVAADYALIFGHWGAPEMGVVGAAWAAVLSSAVGLGVGLLALGGRYRDYLRRSVGQLFDRAALRHLMSTNIYLLARTLCLLLSQFFLLAVVSRTGEVSLAAHAILWQVWGLVSYAVDGFAHAAETLVGNSLGAGDYTGTRQVCRRIMLWGIGIGSCFATAFAIGMEEVAAAFTEHGEVVAAIAPLTPHHSPGATDERGGLRFRRHFHRSQRRRLPVRGHARRGSWPFFSPRRRCSFFISTGDCRGPGWRTLC